MLLSRGKLIGDIIDNLSLLSFTIETRSKLGLYDINRHCENFAKDLLNKIYDYNLINLNERRSNLPGLDLGDISKKVAYQITSDKRTSKVNDTLSAITDELESQYEKIYILILGTKQKAYSGLNADLCSRYHFSEDNIIDFNDINTIIMGLPIDKVKEIHDMISSEMARVMSDFETINDESKSEPTIYRVLEPKPDHIFTNCSGVVEYIKVTHGVSLEETKINKSVNRLITELLELPRVTREFLSVLISRSDYNPSRDSSTVRYEIITRILSLSPHRINEEISLLESHDLLQVIEIDKYNHDVVFKGSFEGALRLTDILEYLKAKNIDIKKVFIELDFSCFAL